MTWKYGISSSAKRDTCHPVLIQVLDRGLIRSPVDIKIIWGFRNEAEQNGMFDMKVSQKRWPDSDHNHMENGKPCSLAFDFAPWVNGDINWNDTHMFAVVAGVFFAAANEIGCELGWGGDWDLDGTTMDQRFMDWGHMWLRGV